jgi:hypothetical protein
MDPEANNYNPEATVDDGTCEYTGCPDGQVQDCADADCCQEAWIGDGVCDGEDDCIGDDCSGCVCPGDDNGGGSEGGCWQTNPLTGDLEWYDDCGGGWEFDIPGCTDPDATNYNEFANIDDGTCYYGWNEEACLATECGQMLQGDWSCDQILEYGVDCSECETCSTGNYLLLYPYNLKYHYQ